MKKILAMLCAAMLCACCVALAACGGSSSSSAAASGSASASSASASASASASSASAAVSYAGDWKFAGMEADMGTGKVTMVGDLDAISQAFGGTSDSMTFGLTLKEDGTGSFVSSDNTYAITWTDNGKGITISEAADASASSASASSEAASSSAASADTTDGLGGIGDSVDLAYSDGVLSMSAERDGQSVTIFFSKDGKLPGASEITVENAKPITNEADLIGDWKLSGMNMIGMSIYGDPDTIAGLMGESADMNLKFEAGGKGSFGGTDVTYTVGSDGAVLDMSGTKMSVKALDDSILVDMSDTLGMSMILAYSK